MVKTKMTVQMKGNKLPPQNKLQSQDIFELKVIGKKRSQRIKSHSQDITMPKKPIQRNICNNDMLHEHLLEEEQIQKEKSLVSNHDRESFPFPNDVNMEKSPIRTCLEHFSLNPNEKVTPNHNSIPILDSSPTRTRLAMGRQVATSDENMAENKDNTSGENPFDTTILPKRTRGPTKMKTIAVDKQSRVDLDFNEYGQPIGEQSVGLSSFLGSLVREVVPVNLENWKKLPTRLKIVLWKSIQSRYHLNDDWQKKFFFQKMGRLWRAGKSRLVRQIRNATTNDALLKLMPDNLQSVEDWMDFVKEKTSASFMLKSEKYKAMKKKQLPHTCSRKGYARLAEEMKKSCSDPSSITRIMLWMKAHKKKDGQPVNVQVAKTIERIEQIEVEKTSSTNNVVDDALSKALGPDCGHVRGLGFGVTRSKLSLLSQQDNRYTILEKEYLKIKEEMVEVKSMMSCFMKKQVEPEELSNATISVHEPTNIHTNFSTPSPSSNTNNTQIKCKLVDWHGSREIVAEGRWSSNDPTALVHHIPIGPHAVRVWVDVSKKPNAYLWRPTSEMTCIEEAVGSTIAWPSDKVIISE